MNIKDLKVGVYYEDGKGNILLVTGLYFIIFFLCFCTIVTTGSLKNNTVTYHYDGQESKTESLKNKRWKERKDLWDFPNAKDPKLPYDFDLLWDLKHISQLKKVLKEGHSDYNEIKKMAEKHNLIDKLKETPMINVDEIKKLEEETKQLLNKREKLGKKLNEKEDRLFELISADYLATIKKRIEQDNCFILINNGNICQITEIKKEDQKFVLKGNSFDFYQREESVYFYEQEFTIYKHNFEMYSNFIENEDIIKSLKDLKKQNELTRKSFEEFMTDELRSELAKKSVKELKQSIARF